MLVVYDIKSVKIYLNDIKKIDQIFYHNDLIDNSSLLSLLCATCQETLSPGIFAVGKPEMGNIFSNITKGYFFKTAKWIERR